MTARRGKPIMIGGRDMHDRFQIQLVQQTGAWQPHKPSKKAREYFQQTYSVYDLPSNEQAITWMHAKVNMACSNWGKKLCGLAHADSM
jgi:hypothetical protein